MADRIIAALEYLDAHTSLVLQKRKHRSLGDIDAKYEVIDPTELPMSKIMHDSVALAGTQRSNLSKQKTIDQILDEDRKRLVQSAQGTRSTPGKSCGPSRPLTSSSRISRDRRGKVVRPDSQMTTSSRTSIKRLPFTPPGVVVGPTDARDEVMEEIVNKPLTHTPSKARNWSAGARQAASTPLPGAGCVVSVGCRSLTSLKRSKTFHGRSGRSDKRSSKWEAKPGPFATVKVSGPDMWVVADSTPTTYFDGEVVNGLIMNGTEGSKLPRWEDTADSIPREEKKSVPRFERKLGAPPQFGPTSQWYTFAGADPSKKQPVLTSFADDQAQEYYNIESEISATVADQLQASPGIRIGRNGIVITDSMKILKNDNSNDQTDEEGYQSADPNEQSDDGAPQHSENGEMVSNGRQNSNASSGHEDKSVAGVADTVTTEPEDKKFTLLRFVGVANGENPYVGESTSSSTSSSSVTAMLANMKQNGKSSLLNGVDSKADDTVWKLLKEASPSFWITKEKWKRMRENLIQKKVKRELAVAQETASPLSWNAQLQQSDAKVLESKLQTNCDSNEGTNDSLPVVFNKLLSSEQLPIGFVHLTGSGYRPHSAVAKVDKDLDMSAPSKGYQSVITSPPRSAKLRATSAATVSFDTVLPPRSLTAHSKRNGVTNDLASDDVDLTEMFRVTQDSLPNRTTSEAASFDKTGVKDDISEEELQAVRREAAHNMKLTGRLGPVISETEDLSSKKSVQHSGPSEFADQKENLSSRTNSAKAVTLNSLMMKAGATISTVDIRPSLPRSSMPVSALNLSEINEDYNVINGPNPPSPASPSRAEEAFEIPPNHVVPKSRASVYSKALRAPKSSPVSRAPSQRDAKASDGEPSPASNENFPHERTQHGIPAYGARLSSTSRKYSAPPKSASIPVNNGELPRHPAVNRGFYGASLTGRPSGGRSTNRFGSTSSKGSRPVGYAPQITENGGRIGEAVNTKPGFIQISHSLHVPPQRASSAKTGKGNKVYNSYMRELSSRAVVRSVDGEVNLENSKGVVVKSLGGTSGRSVPDQTVSSKMLRSAPLVPNFRAKSSPQSINMHNGAARRAGYAFPYDYPAYVGHPSRSTANRSADFGLQGDTVRLNLDKNIHVIYRDLGLLTKSGIGAPATNQSILTYQEVQAANATDRKSLRSAGRRSDSHRSKLHSAKSGDSYEEVGSMRSTVVTIPTANSSADLRDNSVNQGLPDVRSGDMGANEAVLNHAREEYSSSKSASRSKQQPSGNDVKTENSGISAPSQPYSTKGTASTHNENAVIDFGTQYNPAELQAFEPDPKMSENRAQVFENDHGGVEEEQHTHQGEPVALDGIKKLSENTESPEYDQGAENRRPRESGNKSSEEADEAEMPKILDQKQIEQLERDQAGVDSTPHDAVAITAPLQIINETSAVADEAKIETSQIPRINPDPLTEETNTASAKLTPEPETKEIALLTSAEAKADPEENEETKSRQLERRSLSESHLDVGEKIHVEDTNEVGEDLVDDTVDVRGVTKVTVNIQPIART